MKFLSSKRIMELEKKYPHYPYKTREVVTPEQSKKVDKLIAQNKMDEAAKLQKKYEWDNLIDEVKEQIENGLVEGMGMEVDD